MRIVELASKKGKAGSNGAWESYHWTDDSGVIRGQIWHYNHAMLSWKQTKKGSEVTQMSIGWGSVSDQGGMNQLFRALRLPYYYSRKGGSQILTIVGTHDDGRVTGKAKAERAVS